MKRIMFAILALGVLALGACGAAAAPLTDETIIGRLEEIDAYRRGIPPRATASPNPAQTSLYADEYSFRNVPYGIDMESIVYIEELPLIETFTDALDFGYAQVFSQSMLATYWFNDSGEFYRGSYFIQTDNAEQALVDIEAGLTQAYGEASEYTFYTFGGQQITYDTFAEGMAEVAAGDSYYYMSYPGGGGMMVDVYAEIATTPGSGAYDIYVYFTNYDYYY